MKLMQITYCRKNNKADIKTAIVTQTQVLYFSKYLKHIKIITAVPAPKDSQRSYILN